MRKNRQEYGSGRKRSRNLGIATAAAVMLAMALIMTARGGNDGEETEEQNAEASNAEVSNAEVSSSGEALAAEEGTVAAWAEAFCQRDGARIAAMCGEEAEESMREQYLLDNAGEETEGAYLFGWSSPWPWDPESDYEILEETDSSADILYYAHVSDPHVTVWRETLSFHRGEKGILADDEALEMFEAICTKEEFERAYPHGINGTPMDYLENGLGEALNENAKEGRSVETYARLFEPETAAVTLLNLLNNPNKVQVEADGDAPGGRVAVNITFTEFGGSVIVEMIRPYGTDGIWIVQNYPSEP